MIFTWRQFHRTYQRKLSLISVWKLLISYYNHISRGANELNKGKDTLFCLPPAKTFSGGFRFLELALLIISPSQNTIIFPKIFTTDTPMRVRYWVCFVSYKSEPSFVLYARSWYIGPCYDGVKGYNLAWVCLWRLWMATHCVSYWTYLIPIAWLDDYQYFYAIFY